MKLNPTRVENAIGALEQNRYFPLNPQGGAISKHRFSALGATSLLHQLTGKSTLSSADTLHTATSKFSNRNRRINSEHIRDRSNSSKRKAEESDRQSKLIRLEEKGKTLHDAMQNNKSLLDELASEIFEATSSDQVVIGILAKLHAGMCNQHDILGSMLSEHEILKILLKESGERQLNMDQTPVDKVTAPVINLSDNCEYPSISSRKPLNQAPLGDGPWVQALNRKSQKSRKAEAQNKVSDNNAQTDKISDPTPAKPAEDAFATTVREAERSVIVYNLDLGQAPIINPSTISSKVTAALYSHISNFEESATAKEVVSDILSMVRSMDCLGTSTRPNKDPRNKANNGKFYTIPVKLAFNNKPMAKQVTDLLRRKYKLSTSIPYHKSLKASITLVYKKLETEHPGYQVKVNLDTVNRKLRGSIRKPPTPDPESQKWTHLGKAYPLPPEALDTKLRDIPTELSIPCSPTLESRYILPSPTEMDTGENSNQMTPVAPGNQSNSTESAPWFEQVDKEMREDSAENQLSRTVKKAGTGRSSLTPRTPPPGRGSRAAAKTPPAGSPSKLPLP